MKQPIYFPFIQNVRSIVANGWQMLIPFCECIQMHCACRYCLQWQAYARIHTCAAILLIAHVLELWMPYQEWICYEEKTNVGHDMAHLLRTAHTYSTIIRLSIQSNGKQSRPLQKFCCVIVYDSSTDSVFPLVNLHAVDVDAMQNACVKLAVLKISIYVLVSICLIVCVVIVI